MIIVGKNTTSTGLTVGYETGGMYISNGGVANSTTVNEEGTMHICSGGVASNTKVNSGFIHIYSGGTATDIIWTPCEGRVIVEDGAYITYASQYSGVYFGSNNHLLSSASTMDNKVVSGSMYVMSGGVANSTTVDEDGTMYISSGGVANSTTINAYGSMFISSGGTATDIIWTPCVGYISAADGAYVTYASQYSGVYFGTHGKLFFSTMTMDDKSVGNGEYMYVMSGGVANSTTVNTHGNLTISSGGVANSTIVDNGGDVYISSGGVANDTVLSGIYYAAAMHVLSGGVANHTTVNSGGWMYISSGGVANSTTVNSEDLHIFSGGVANETTLNSGGDLDISSGGVANSTTVNSGHLYISNGGVANNTTVNSDGIMRISSGGVANSTTVSRGYMEISSGGVASSTTVNSGGGMRIYSGGTATDIVVADGGRLTIAVAPDTYIQWTSNGSSFEMKDATINGYTLISGGRMEVEDGGVVNDTTVNSGGYLSIRSGGTATNVIWTPCVGSVYVADGAYVTYTSQYSGVYFGSNNQLLSSASTMDNKVVFGSMYVMSDGIANSTTVNSGGSMYIYNGGVANSTVVNSYGWMYISSGGVANDTTVNSYGRMVISSGGVANSTTVNSGHLYISNGGVANNTTVNSDGIMRISSGGVANSTTVSRGYMEISRGGVANSTTVSGGYMDISSGGVANSTTVNDMGFMFISSGGVANSTTVSGGYMELSSGGVANDTIVSYGNMYISSGGVANSTVVNSGGSMVISSGGTALEIIENGGYVSIENGANVTFCSNTLNGLTLTNRATVHSGTVAIDTVVYYGRIYIYSSGVANSTMVNSGGSMTISSGGVANSTIVNSGGGVWITSGGVANSTTVNSGGSMYISSGGMINGNLEIADGGKVTVYEGGIIDFTVAEQESADTALINDISRITDNGAVYTLTVAEDQAFGNYILAGGATKFNETITVKTADTELGILVIGREFVLDGVIYALKLIDNNLIFVMNDLTPPELDVTVSQKESLDYEFVVKISEPASLQYKIDNGDWQDADGTTIAIAQNGTYSFQATDLAGNMSEVVTKEISGLVFGNPEKVETDGGKTSWTPVKDESGNVQQVVVQYSVDNFKTVVTVITTESALQVLSAAGNMQWRVKGGNSIDWMDGEKIIAPENAVATPQKIEAVKDGVADIFFARTDGRWSVIHQARHQGIKGGWTGTQETASLDGKSKVVDVFSGADDANVLYLTDDAKGDALFVDDIYGDSFEGIAKTQARIANLDEIRAGAGDDVVDMTSQRFSYIGDGVTIYGGDGNDVIWSNKGDNKLFGDAGNDHIVGASGNDVIVGGAGDDTLHGGGGDDIFCFGSDWGIDTVDQLSGGTVTLWFEDGSEENWNANTRTYSDGENTVTVSGTADVTLKFGGDVSSLPESIFSNAVTKKIFESTLA